MSPHFAQVGELFRTYPYGFPCIRHSLNCSSFTQGRLCHDFNTIEIKLRARINWPMSQWEKFGILQQRHTHPYNSRNISFKTLGWLLRFHSPLFQFRKCVGLQCHADLLPTFVGSIVWKDVKFLSFLHWRRSSLLVTPCVSFIHVCIPKLLIQESLYT